MGGEAARHHSLPAPAAEDRAHPGGICVWEHTGTAHACTWSLP